MQIFSASRPLHWVEVRDPNGGSLTYWWSPETNQTTSLGAARPSYLSLQVESSDALGGMRLTQAGSMKFFFFWGFGLAAASSIVTALFH